MRSLVLRLAASNMAVLTLGRIEARCNGSSGPADDWHSRWIAWGASVALRRIIRQSTGALGAELLTGRLTVAAVALLPNKRLKLTAPSDAGGQ